MNWKRSFLGPRPHSLLLSCAPASPPRWKAATDEEHFPSTIDPRIYHVKVIREHLGTLAGKRVLDIGCGKGRFLRALARRRLPFPRRELSRQHHPRTSRTSPKSNLVGQVATIEDATRNYVLLPVSEEVHAEMCNCETSNDALAISLMVAAEKLLLVNCGTRVQILDASNAALGCKVRILGGQFVGEKAFAPRA